MSDNSVPYHRVTGIDPSLTALGLATAYPAGDIVAHTVTPRDSGCARLDQLRDHARTHVDLYTLVVIEGPSHGSPAAGRQRGHHERAGLWWLLTWTLWRLDIDVAVCPPATLKKWATGKGTASKDQVLLAVERRFPTAAVVNNNEADAAVLAAIGAHALGWLPEQPQYSRDALLKVQWPSDDISAALLEPYEQPIAVEATR